MVEEGPPDQVLINPTTDRTRRFLCLMADATPVQVPGLQGDPGDNAFR